MANVKESIKLLFDRPSEPLLTPKGDNKLFQLTEQFLTPEYAATGIDINNRYGEDEGIAKIPLKNLASVPQLRIARRLPKDADFSLFIPYHREMAGELIDVLMAVPENELQDYLSTCAYARVNVNPQLFNYCFSVSLLHRKDTRDIPIQNYAETFPSKFLDGRAFGQAREVTEIINERQTSGAAGGTAQTRPRRSPIIIPRDYTATDRDLEHRVAYFREDIGVNLHHWHWHLVYPFTANDRAIVAKDRRGELFFYMHQQIIARYNVERLCNQLPLVKKLSNWREPIPEAYFPKLDNLTTARGWPPRQAGMTWQDVNRPVDNLQRSVADLELWRRNIEEAISTGLVRLPGGSTQPLDIDTLGNMMEASILSPNREYYGDLHNTGHVLSAYIHDPDHRYLESFAVIADEATTMRDPLFYRWHAFIDDTFQKFKQSAAVRPYSRSELDNPGVRVQSAQITSAGGQPNVLETFWMRSDVDLSRGLDFSNRGPVYARFTHINNRPFSYTIMANNTGSSRRATVRIFLGPKVDESNRAWNLADHRKMFMEMDRFVAPLNSGMNRITRNSSQSSVTIPFEQTFRDLSPQGTDPRQQSLASFNYCGCGWPQHMLVPKGTEGGYRMQLFVMLSNYDLDRVEQPDGTVLSCDDASSFCGLQDKLFPDRRSMGFPFDRPSDYAAMLADFITPNMFVTEVTVRHRNTTEDNPKNPQN